MKLIFTGDINFRGIDGLDIEKCREIVSEVKPYFEKCNFSIVNLETHGILCCRAGKNTESAE